ncbi:transglutaminase family protein [Actinomyces radicidentis]|uniref:transglutaminase family protein n=1 Tax=Actinomyces radicidentis TaxID=111015 RepID=UPI0028E52CA4|nr:transglutaminase family protein [Actinomyces radicidentis]
MTTTLGVVHTTGYRYEGRATGSINEARMIPRSDAEQTVLSSRIEIAPTAWTHRWTDYFGTGVVAFEIHEPHEEMRLVATSTVDVTRPPAQGPAAGEGIHWEELGTDELRSRLAEYLTMSPLVEPAEDLRALVASQRERAAEPRELIGALRAAVTGHVAYVPGSTDVTTRAAQAWEVGSGVCQDLSHVLIGALRAAGVPARYVSGYLGPGLASAPVVTVATGQSHAWVEALLGRWVPLDPTNRAPVLEEHVAVGHGRDYADVAPLRGVFTGAPAESMFVDVVVTRMR